MKQFRIKVISILVFISILLPTGFVKAQNTAIAEPVYVVQQGDSLWDIAYRFHVSQQDLANANGILNANQITVGQQLVIPGLEGIQGILTTQPVEFGETLHSLSLRFHLSESTLTQLNRLTSPNELYAGYSLVILQEDNPHATGKRVSLLPDQSLLELSILTATDAWTLLSNNQYDSSSEFIPGDVIKVPGEADPGSGALPADISSVSITGLEQGQTSQIEISGNPGISFQGSFMDHKLNFSPDLENGYFALQGIHAMAEPGLYPLNIQGTLPDGSNFNFTQNVLVTAGDFLFDIPLNVDPATLDPATTGPEDKKWRELASQVSPEKMWQGVFSLPVEPVFAECYASRFGSRRSYNGSEYSYYHTGLDYCGQVGDPIYAAAPGVVVFAGPLTVRGNATMIDHGLGVYTAYMHQSELLVNVGDKVKQGQLIGRVGNTGRVEGPHLHFEVLVGGVPVNPLDWLSKEFP
jgi:murein DD-endopeptidase MepM/ murein hydrolase activator NlpD